MPHSPGYGTLQTVRISVIIPVKPGGYVAALDPLQRLDDDSPDFEVIVAEGSRPSRQRNLAAAAAGGDILYFLDDDALVQADALKRLAAAFAEPKVVVVGGPSLTPDSDSMFQRAIGQTLSSAFGGGAIRNRYRQHGRLRETDDRELILCNLAIRKAVFLESGGLDERLYPNEENELIDRLRASGARLLHDPDMFVTRSQRPTYRAFIRQMLTYGRGRAEQSLLSRTFSFKAIIPVLFACYLLSLPLSPGLWYFIPALAYLVALLVTIVISLGRAGASLALRMPLLFLLLHFCYGFGFLVGLLSPRYRQLPVVSPPVMLRRAVTKGASWQNEDTAAVESAI